MNIVEPIKNLDDIKKIKKYFSNNERNSLLFSLGINRGLRISDILALNVSDVKNKEFIVIREKKTNKYKRFPINKNLQLDIISFVKNIIIMTEFRQLERHLPFFLLQ